MVQNIGAVRKKSIKFQKSHFWIDLDKYYPIPPKKIKIIYSKNFLLCHPNLEADLQRNAATSQAFKIAPLRASFCRLYHFPKAVTEEDDALIARYHCQCATRKMR
jgi:hypothetical protein